MESDDSPASTSLVKCCDCDCSCSMMNRSLSGTYLRTVKRKYEEFEEENRFFVPGVIIPQVARVEIGNECIALREMVANQQQTIQDLISELEEERNASSSAANEAMSMILRLQKEKAEVQMELRQFKRFAEEKMAHDQQESIALDDLLYKREQTIQSLACEVHAYKHRMLSYGLTEAEADGDKGMSRNTSMNENLDRDFEFPPYEFYPPLKCSIHESQDYADGDDETGDIEKYAFGETPKARKQLKDLEYRINQLEKTPKTIQPDGEFTGAKNVFEKAVVGQSPRRSRHLRKFSTESSSSFFAIGKETSPDYAADSPKYGNSFRKTEFSHIEEHSNSKKVDYTSDVGDDMSDRVYTIDSIHQAASVNGTVEPKVYIGASCDDYMTTPRESDLEVQKLYARLQALEADRESMRQAIFSIGTDKAQLVLLKEIAQNLCKDMAPARNMPVRKQSVNKRFSFLSAFKWIVSFVFWRRKAHRSRYMYELSANNPGLLMLLDRGSQWRYQSTTIN